MQPVQCIEKSVFYWYYSFVYMGV